MSVPCLLSLVCFREVGEYARMALPALALEEKVALVFALDDKKARLHPQETIESGADFVIASFIVQSCY